RESLTKNGYLILPAVLDKDECDEVIECISPLQGQAVGTRNLLAEPWCKLQATRLINNSGISALLPDNVRAVQCTYFEKSPVRNWSVAFHQDLSIPVKQRI